MRISPRGALVALALVLAAGGSGHGANALLFEAEVVPATSTSAASFTGTRYSLHNNPTPPVGGTLAQADLGMDTVSPTATVLHNYDTNHDALPGRRIARGGSGPTEANLARHQNWRGPSGAANLTLMGTVTVELWTAVDGFAPGVAGDLTIYLRDITVLTGTATEIASASVAMPNWHAASSGWVKVTASINVPLHVLLVGHVLEVKVIAGPTAGADMLVAYDTVTEPSRVRLP
jgi:hypothetical protein